MRGGLRGGVRPERMRRWGGGLALALALGALGACAPEMRHRVLSTIFDGVPPLDAASAKARVGNGGTAAAPTAAAPPARANPDGAPEPAAIAFAPTPAYGGAFPTYDDLAAALPRDAMGNLDWVEAVEHHLIQPSPSINPEAKPSLPIDLDVRLDPGVPGFEVVFPHDAHTYWLRCDNCHPEIFEMRAGANPISMAKIFAGEYCGRCHGRVAFAPQTGCPRCHVRMGQG